MALYEKTGVFTVRSAYRMLVSNREKRTDWIEHNPGRSDCSAERKEWTDIWQVQVPSKVRQFLWRLARQSIPTGDVRHQRHMAPDSRCVVCGGLDSWKHSLIECHQARCVWALQSEEIVDFISSTQQQDARGWLHEAMNSLSHDVLVKMVVTMWAIWYAKRKIIHENNYQSPLSTHCFVERFLADLAESKPVQKEWKPAQAKQPGWIPPPPGFGKINVDAALAKNTTKFTMAAVARDEAGNFLGASALVMEGITDPEMAEAMACREGMALASDLVLQKFKLASDCLNVVRNLQGTAMGAYGHIIRKIKARAEDFTEVRFTHEGREANGDAHRLAKGSVHESFGRHVWFITSPDGVCTAVNAL